MNADQSDVLETESFRDIAKYTGAGFLLGLAVAGVLDAVGWKSHAFGQWLVRTLAGESESIFEGIFALRRRMTGAAGSLAEAYGWGKVLGMVAPWIVDVASRLAGLDVTGVEGFFIPYFYAMSDQIGGSVSSLVFLRRREQRWASAIKLYVRHPVMEGMGSGLDL